VPVGRPEGLERVELWQAPRHRPHFMRKLQNGGTILYGQTLETTFGATRTESTASALPVNVGFAG
jgi:hypothetical protein